MRRAGGRLLSGGLGSGEARQVPPLVRQPVAGGARLGCPTGLP